MARDKNTEANIDRTDPVNYPNGRIKDNTGSGDGTPINEYLHGDIHEFFAEAMRASGVAYNNLPDNKTNGYQLVRAVKGLAGKNDLVYSLSSISNVLQIPIRMGQLQDGETLICKAQINKGSQTTVRGTLDNSIKAATFVGNFKSGEYVRLINSPTSVIFIRLVDMGNLDRAVNELLYLKKASQAIENSGSSDKYATTPKSNKSVFATRVNGSQSNGFLASQNRNGLLSKTDKKRIDELGLSSTRNIGSVSGIEIETKPIGGTYPVSGDATRAVKVSKINSGDLIEVTIKNAMSNNNYFARFNIISEGNVGRDNDIKPIVLVPVSTTKFRFYIEETNSVAQNIKLVFELVQL